MDRSEPRRSPLVHTFSLLPTYRPAKARPCTSPTVDYGLRSLDMGFDTVQAANAVRCDYEKALQISHLATYTQCSLEHNACEGPIEDPREAGPVLRRAVAEVNNGRLAFVNTVTRSR